MFTVKFLSNTKEGFVTEAISCPHYSVFERGPDNITVTVYPKYTKSGDGVDYHISSMSRDFSACFIENESGKTIARFSIPRPEPVTA